MADGLCDWDSDTPHPRNHILTTISPPGTVELCDDHYGPGMIPLVAAELGLDPGDFYANVERYAKRVQAKYEKDLAAALAAEVEQNVAEDLADKADGPEADLPAPNFYPADGPAYAEQGGEAE